MNKKREYQLDIYGNWKLVDIVRKENSFDKKYQSKRFNEKRKKLKNGWFKY